MTDSESEAVQRTRELLDEVEDDHSMVFLVGDGHDLDVTLEAGELEPTTVHVHLLASHIRALADVLDSDPSRVTNEALGTLQQMEANGAVSVSHPLGTEGDE